MILFQLTDEIDIFGNYAAESVEIAECFAKKHSARVCLIQKFTGNINDYPKIVLV